MGNLSGPFKDIIPNFRNYKKSLGYKYDNINQFYKIDKILYENNIQNLNNTKLIFDILVNNEKNDLKKKNNYEALKQLYNFMEIIGYKNLYFETLYFNETPNFKATILTHKQLLSFFTKLDSFCKNLNKPECYIYPALFRLLYSNGLRISEALNLKISQISLENQWIYIEQAKENITRKLPLSSSMKIVLEQYYSKISIKKQIYLFEINNSKLPKSKVDTIFKKILENFEVSFRIHDLRHLMAVTSFNLLYDKGYKEDWILYYLHIYLGHKSISSTEYYLQHTEKRYKKTVKKIAEVYPDIFPKLGGVDNE